ncbi:MAG: hypothetical protein M1605_05885 [Candidatus Thermoplasmatota archaeon]|nr:hypothetical protein [Candidatus Thermoplasmatota archaeon]
MGMQTIKILKEKGFKSAVGHLLSYVTVKNLFIFFGLLLIAAPLAFYVGWSVAYGTWGDVGVYSFTAPLVVFGILTIALAREKYGTQVS